MDPQASRRPQHLVFILTILLSLLIFQGQARASLLPLTWVDTSNNEDGFRVERQTNGGVFTQIVTLGANVTQYNDTALVENTTYCYRVRAFNAYGNSGYSNSACVTALSAGRVDFCSRAAPCGAGEGDCDSNRECQSGLVCVHNVGADYGWGSGIDVCEAPVPGHVDFCSRAVPCGAGEGDCDSNRECQSGLVCVHNVGADYGWGSGIDVCEVPVSAGHVDFCSGAAPCRVGEGDCDSDRECQSGLVCVHNVGADYGWGSGVDVCEAP